MTTPIPPMHFVGLEVHALDSSGAPTVINRWFLRSFQLQETVSEPFSLRVSLATDDVDLRVPAIVGGRVRFRFGRGAFERDVQGVIVNAETIGVINGQLRVNLWVAPTLQLLGLSRRYRVFQGQTAVEIVAAVLQPAFEAYGGTLNTDRLADITYRRRDQCVQFDETDLQLVQRLLAEEGIAFSFSHEGDTETMVLMPATACLHSVAAESEQTPASTPVHARDFELASHESIQSLSGSTQARAAGSGLSMHDWQATPTATLDVREARFPADAALLPALSRFGETLGHESYRPVEQTEGGPLFEQLATEIRLEGQRQRIDDVRGKGTSNVVGFTDGGMFEVSDHPAPDLDGMYVVLSVTHHAQFDPKDNGVVQGPATAYTNSFRCHRFEVPDGASYDYAPPLRAKPRASGPMTATVVGPEGEEIHTDRHGRIKVRMHWDREGLARGDHETSCWVPVGQVWAGPGYGAVFIPRVGMDVVISFLAGDPDRPLCTGVVYDGSNEPPYPLPDSKTRSVIRTSSSPGGGGYNELSFEDAAGSEEVFLRAQRNLREVVKSSHTTSVGCDQSITVGRERTLRVKALDREVLESGRVQEMQFIETTIQGGRSTGVGLDPKTALNDDDTLEVRGWRSVSALRGHETIVPDNSDDNTSIKMTPGEIVITAETSIVLKVGTTELKLTPDTLIGIAAACSLNSASSALKVDENARLESKHEVALVREGGSSLTLTDQADLNAKAMVTMKAKAITMKAKAIALADPTGGALTIGDHKLETKATDIVSNAIVENKIKGGKIQLN